jgi:hypothetical protein
LKEFAQMRAATCNRADEASSVPDSSGAGAPGAESFRLEAWMRRTEDRLRDRRVRIAALHREWERTEVGGPGELGALVRLWQAQTAYVETLRLAHRVRSELRGSSCESFPSSLAARTAYLAEEV